MSSTSASLLGPEFTQRRRNLLRRPKRPDVARGSHINEIQAVLHAFEAAAGYTRPSDVRDGLEAYDRRKAPTLSVVDGDVDEPIGALTDVPDAA